MSLGSWIALALLGGGGAVARLEIDRALGGRLKTEFPVGTFAINVSGAFALGVLVGAGLAGGAFFAVGTGFLGSFTTFSTWMFETQRLSEDGETGVALTNLVASVAAGLAAGGAGWALGALL